MKILVCPLNWGLGHATRCIPLIKKLMTDNHELVIATDGYPLHLLKTEFPLLRFIELPSYNIRYNKGKSQLTAMFRSIPKIFAGIIREHYWLKKLNQQEQFDQIISDNRFGLWNKNSHSIYMTHQLMIKMPRLLKFLEPAVWLGHRFFINRFDACLIPDNAEMDNFSGDLSHLYPLPRNAKFIGILSRFSDFRLSLSVDAYETVAIISGPEPQRSIFEKQLIDRFSAQNEKTLLIQGLPGNTNIHSSPTKTHNLHIVPHMNTELLAAHLTQAKKIICRSGYSTIMDLVALNCLDKAELIPTPGQTEQTYLATYLQTKTAGSSPTVSVN